VHRRLRAVGLVGIMALLSGLLFATAGAATSALSASATIRIQPEMFHRWTSTAQPFTEAECVADFTVPCYDPAQFQTAYNEWPLFSHGITGAGQTIVIVDSFGAPTIQSDLATFGST
jgi:subtilase family serine protease